MSEAGSYKWIEVVLLLAAGAGFAWWQFRDLKRAQEETRRQREREAKQAEDKEA
jgi:hypothetical protein